LRIPVYPPGAARIAPGLGRGSLGSCSESASRSNKRNPITLAGEHAARNLAPQIGQLPSKRSMFGALARTRIRQPAQLRLLEDDFVVAVAMPTASLPLCTKDAAPRARRAGLTERTFTVTRPKAAAAAKL